jgi:hypothetical protein
MLARHLAPAGFNDYPAQPVQPAGDSPDFCDRSRRRACDGTNSENVKRIERAADAVATGKELRAKIPRTWPDVPVVSSDGVATLIIAGVPIST